MNFYYLLHKKGIFFFSACVAMISIALCVMIYSLLNGCSQTKSDKMPYVTKQQAVELAIKALREKGYRNIAEEYDTTVDEKEDVWVVVFELKMSPPPPYQRPVVYISKRDGSVVWSTLFP